MLPRNRFVDRYLNAPLLKGLHHVNHMALETRTIFAGLKTKPPGGTRNEGVARLTRSAIRAAAAKRTQRKSRATFIGNAPT